MAEWQLFPEGTTPEYTTAGWYAGRDRAPHLEQPGHRERLLATRDHVVAVPGISTVVDLGCGDGGLLSLLSPSYRAWGYDLSPQAVRGAVFARKVKVLQADVIQDAIDWAHLAVATEIFEHLVDPHAFARKIARHSKALVASSPARETPGAHYEFHTWAWDMDGYRALVEQAGFTVTRHEEVCGSQVITGVRQ